MHHAKTSAFTLIEVIVAASILSITIFGVYKLIGENTKLMSNHDQYNFANTLFPTLQECIEYIGVDNFAANSSYNFHFGIAGDECLTGDSHAVVIDSIEYSFSGTTSSDITDKIDWNLEISSELVHPIYKEYTQLR